MITWQGPIPITILPFFWFLVIMIGWLSSQTIEGTLIWACVIFLSVLVHEFGHALTAVFFGQRAEIYLEGMGGVTKREGPSLSKWKDFLIVLNGPLAGLSLYLFSVAVFPWALSQGGEILYFFKVMQNVNLFWTVLNLFPVLPLDGGHLLRLFLEGFFGFKGLKISLLFSVIFGAFCAIFFLLIGQFFIGILFLMLAFESFKGWSALKSMQPQDESVQLQLLLNEAKMEIRQGQQVSALEKIDSIRQSVSEGILYTTATELGARIFLNRGEWQRAYDWLYPLRHQLSPFSLTTLQQAAYQLKKWKEATSIGEEAYQGSPSIQIALLSAFSYGMLGEAVPAAGWLRCAHQMGLTDVKEVLTKKEFDGVRNDPAFKVFFNM